MVTVITHTHLYTKYFMQNVLQSSYIVTRGFGPDWVFSSEGNTAHSNDQQDTHLKITQGADVVARPAKPGCSQKQFFFPSHL